jgi:hypothetical protein
MSPVILASQSQALPLLFLPLAMAGAHPDAPSARAHLSPARPAAIQFEEGAGPFLSPANANSCKAGSASEGIVRKIGDRYIIVIDPRSGAAAAGPSRRRHVAAM